MPYDGPDRRQEDRDMDRRVTQLEDDWRTDHDAMGDLQTVVMGPPPNRNNGIRGDLRALKVAFYADRDSRAKEDGEVKVASISTRGVILAAAIPSSISALVTILVVILAR